MTEEVSRPDNNELLHRLTPEQYAVTQMRATEPPFSGVYCDHHVPGTYRCVCCGHALFDSDTKFDSGSGWPSFFRPAADDRVTISADNSHGMQRTEVSCGACGAHLGHVFDDGPQPTGQRYCINSLSLDFCPIDPGSNASPTDQP